MEEIRSKQLIKQCQEGMDTPKKTTPGEFLSVSSNHEMAGLWNTNKPNFAQTVADQISVSLSEIVQNEHWEQQKNQITQLERERRLLLALSSYMAEVRNKQELLEVVNKHVCPVINFSHSWFYQFNPETRVFSPAFSALKALTDIKDDSKYERFTNLTYSAKTSWIKTIIDSPGPMVFNLTDPQLKQQLPECFDVLTEFGLVQMVSIKLNRFGELSGIWNTFYSEERLWSKDNLKLMKGIADQVSIAISNVEANEALEEREFENSRLLSFSNAVAGVKNKTELVHVFSRHIKELCGVANYCLHWMNDNHRSHAPYLWNTELISSSSPGIEKVLNGQFPLNDGIFNKVRDAGRMIAFDVEKEGLHNEYPFYIQMVMPKEVKQIIAFPVYLGEVMKGFFLANYNDIFFSKQQLVKSICAQLAVSVSNLIATEKVTRQFVEISSYKEKLDEGHTYIKKDVYASQNCVEMIGESSKIKNIFKLINQVAPVDSAVLILGETGTGKELVAKAVHNASLRKNKPMIKLNCAALPLNLIESELFGHEKGSFTGAFERRIGKFELANGGTLFLDEIGEIPLELQSKLLRVLQEKEVERLGGKTTIKVDIRIIAGTNRDLYQEVLAGRFRNDLYYRLNIFPIKVPPLRERKEDIPLLASHFINRFNKKTGKQIKNLSNRALQELQDYSWPGNVRELEHLIERTVLLTKGNTIKLVELPNHNPAIQQETATPNRVKTIEENEREHIFNILKVSNGRIRGPKGAAAMLGVPPTTLASKIKRLGIRRGL